mmetsp:Transcript_3408/g.3445  ORF Transcript_3408/g.3445 Transcript_3408/m.3445 type:complete len:106 (-) Transcript_3408:8-325(-)
MLYTILLIWKKSKYYNTPANICNSLIEQACWYVSEEQILNLIENDEANLAVDKLNTRLLVCGEFRATNFEYKSKAANECLKNDEEYKRMLYSCDCKPFSRAATTC